MLDLSSAHAFRVVSVKDKRAFEKVPVGRLGNQIKSQYNIESNTIWKRKRAMIMTWPLCTCNVDPNDCDTSSSASSLSQKLPLYF